MILSEKRNGLTALVTVVVIGSVALLTSMAIALRGLGEVDLGITSLQGEQAGVILIGCGEEVLLQLSRDQEYARTPVSFPLGNDGSCTVQIVTVPGTGTQTYIARMRAQRSRAFKCATVTVLVPQLELVQWKPVTCSQMVFDQ